MVPGRSAPARLLGWFSGRAGLVVSARKAERALPCYFSVNRALLPAIYPACHIVVTCEGSRFCPIGGGLLLRIAKPRQAGGATVAASGGCHRAARRVWLPWGHVSGVG